MKAPSPTFQVWFRSDSLDFVRNREYVDRLAPDYVYVHRSSKSGQVIKYFGLCKKLKFSTKMGYFTLPKILVKVNAGNK